MGGERLRRRPSRARRPRGGGADCSRGRTTATAQLEPQGRRDDRGHRCIVTAVMTAAT